MQRPLQEPIVSCALGKLYNKDAILEFLLDRSAYGDGEEICGHIRSLKVHFQLQSHAYSTDWALQDVKTLKLTHNPTKAAENGRDSDTAPAPFVCPLNFKEMNGVQPFVYLSTCGCVFSQAGLKAVSGNAGTGSPKSDNDEAAGGTGSTQLDVCPQCAIKYDRSEDVLLLNPGPEEDELMRAAMARRRAAQPKSKGKKRKAKGEAGETEKPAKKAALGPSTNPSIAAASRAVVASLAEEEAKRKGNMSDAVKSLYMSKVGQQKETFMTKGTFTRYA